jgi:hypothetical protein
MQEELDNKMIVIEELETRLDDRSTPRLARRMTPMTSSPSLRTVSSSSSVSDDKFVSEDVKLSSNSTTLQCDVDHQLANESDAFVGTTFHPNSSAEAPTRQRPILSLVMSSSYPDLDALDSRSTSGVSLDATDDVAEQDVHREIFPRAKTAVFVSRDFPSFSSLHCAATNKYASENEVSAPSGYESDSSSESSQEDTTISYSVGVCGGTNTYSSGPLSSGTPEECVPPEPDETVPNSSTDSSPSS